MMTASRMELVERSMRRISGRESSAAALSVCRTAASELLDFNCPSL